LKLLQKTTQILTALAGWTGLTLLMIVNLKVVRVNLGLSVLGSILRSFGYFTVWTNLLVATAVTVPILRPQRRAGRFLSRPEIVSGLLVYIIVVGLIYHVALARIWHPAGIHKIADAIQHYLVPILFLLHWVFVPKGTLGWKLVPWWLLFPTVYFGSIMLCGAIANVYPYPFVDVARLGLVRVLINAGVITLGFTVVGLAVVALDRLLGRTGPNRQLQS